MQAKNCKERILKLKAWRIDKGLTVDQCVELCGDYPSGSTIRKVFAKGSEEKSFRESTIAAIELALLGKVYEPDIKIPVEDVARTLEEATKPLAEENRALRYQVQRQTKISSGLLRLCFTAVLLFGAIAFYDLRIDNAGFWGSKVYWVWIIKAVFLLYAAAVVLGCALALRKLKAEFVKGCAKQEE